METSFTVKEIMHLITQASLLFQRATERIESVTYKQLIAPFVNDMAVSYLDGFRRVCADDNYAYVGPIFLNKLYSRMLPCKLKPLPEASYPQVEALVTSKNNTYRGIINWRRDNKAK
jgi:hypothetical protein